MKWCNDKYQAITTFAKNYFTSFTAWCNMQITYVTDVLIQACDTLHIKCRDIVQHVHHQCNYLIDIWNTMFSTIHQTVYNLNSKSKQCVYQIYFMLTEKWTSLKVLMTRSYEFYRNLYVFGNSLWNNSLIPIFVGLIGVCATAVYVLLINVVIDWLRI